MAAATGGILRFIVYAPKPPCPVIGDDIQYSLGMESILAAGCADPESLGSHLATGAQRIHGTLRRGFRIADAGATISFVPVVIVYVIFQRQFIKGIAAGALSGI